MGKCRYGGQTHFVKWDDHYYTGGRWYECTIGDQMSDGKFHVRAHEGSQEYFYGHDLTPLGTTPGIGDKVIAYWDSRNYAFLGQVSDQKPGHFLVVYQDDGSERWMPEEEVHQLVRAPF